MIGSYGSKGNIILIWSSIHITRGISMSVEGPGRPKVPWWWKKNDPGPIFVHKEEAFAEYRKGIQELKAKRNAEDPSVLEKTEEQVPSQSL